jgi:hypothetical protein
MIIAPLITLAAMASAADPAPADADAPLMVRAGEHGGYSRIVIPNAPETWTLKTEGRTVTVVFPNATQRLDVSGVDKNRKAHRVLNTSSKPTANGDELILTLNCDCEARAERSEHKSLIIDIFDKQAELFVTQKPASPSKKTAATPPTPSRRSPSSDELRAARDRMIALLAAANDQGVVALRSKAGGPINLVPDYASEGASVKPVANASYETGAAPDLGDVDGSAFCIDPARFTDEGPGAGNIAYTDIVELRQRLENAEDENIKDGDQAALEIALGHGYLRLGFFSEAAALASAPDKAANPEFMLLGGLAALGRGNAAGAKDKLEPFSACGGIYDLLLRAASPLASHVESYSNAQYRTLNTLAKSLRGPVAELLALKVLEQENSTAARRLYDIAAAAYAGEETPGLVILRAVLPDNGAEGHPPQDDRVQEKLAVVAQTPGPYRSRALGVLAEEFERKATIAYDGFFDDLAEQALMSATSRGEIDAAISGAKALAAAGRIGAAFAQLRSVKEIAPQTAQATGFIARSMIATALASAEPAQRLAAIDYYFLYTDLFGAEADDNEMRLAIADMLALMGAPKLAARATSKIPSEQRADADMIVANAYLFAGDAEAALTLANKNPDHDGLAEVILHAGAKLDDKALLRKTARQLLQRQKMDVRKATLLWRAEEWRSAADSFASLPPEQLDIETASAYVLTVLKTGGKTLPASAKRALSANKSYARALEHMFAKAPAFDFRNAKKVDAFITGVSWETEFFRQGMNDE